MKVLNATIVTVLITVTQALASQGGANGGGPSLLMILFMGFGALILVFQLFPAIMLLAGMLKGIFPSAGKNPNEAMAANDDTHP